MNKNTHKIEQSSNLSPTTTTEKYGQKYTLIEDSRLGRLLIKHYRAVKRGHGVPIIFTEGQNNYVLNEMLHGNEFRPDICFACYELLYHEDQNELALRMVGTSWHGER